MTRLNIAQQRLHNQHIARATFEKPGDVVAWLGAVQAQDYLGALWAVGLRTQDAVEADIEQALADKTIVRTWPTRGTLDGGRQLPRDSMQKVHLACRIYPCGERRLHILERVAQDGLICFGPHAG